MGQILADLGADVVKVESPEGDDTRHWGPPFVEGADGEALDAAYFHSCNRGKRSIIADLRTQQGQQVVRALAKAVRHPDRELQGRRTRYLVSGRVPRRMGNAHPNIVPYQVFAVRDGYVIIAVDNDAQFARLSAYLGQPELATDRRFATNAARVEHRSELVSLLSTELVRRAREEVLRALETSGIPAGPINNVAEAFAEPQVEHRGMRLQLPCPYARDGVVPGIRTPIRFSLAELLTTRPAPALGEHSAEILGELGLGASGGGTEAPQ